MISIYLVKLYLSKILVLFINLVISIEDSLQHARANTWSYEEIRKNVISEITFLRTYVLRKVKQEFGD